MYKTDVEEKSSSVEQGEEPDPLKPKQPDKPDRRPFEKKELTIKIDRTEFRVSVDSLDDGYMTGDQIRNLVDPPIDHTRDLFEVLLGGSDKKIENADRVKICDWQRFFSAPAQINPG